LPESAACDNSDRPALFAGFASWHEQLSLPIVLPARALYGIGGRPLGWLLFTDWTRVGHRVCHGGAPPVFRKASNPHASASLPPQQRLLSVQVVPGLQKRDQSRNTLKNRHVAHRALRVRPLHTNGSF